MSPTENPEGLLAMTRTLVRKVEDLDQHLKLAQVQARRMKMLTVLSLMFTTISIIGVVVTISLYQQVHDTSQSNTENAVIACRNANDQRQANKSLWTFVLTASAAQNKNQTSQQKLLSQEFLRWITELYAPRDCSDLSRKYTIPPPPKLTSAP